MDGVGIGHRYYPQHQHQQHYDHGPFTAQQTLPQHVRKRKADAPPENNERLSKRMSLLNLEQSGQKLYVPVENPGSHSQPPTYNASPTTRKKHHRKHPVDDSQMQLDDSKYKVYIYDLDDELSSSDNDSDESKLVFLPDIEKHLRNSRIPPHLLDPRPDPYAELAGKELVLYSVPSSISVPEEQDSVRKAIIETRARAREKQRAERELAAAAREALAPRPAMTSSAAAPLGEVPMDAAPLPAAGEDVDAMELD